MKRAIAYYRVSTQRQGRSGLGLDAQMAAVSAFVSRNGLELAAEHCEVESGMRCDRPILQAALQDCVNTKAVLLIAKLDRLGRDTMFVSSLMRSKVEIKAVDNPDAGKLLLHIMAAIAEEERDQISNRTKAALEIARERGVELGKHGKYVLSKLNKRDAERFARNMEPIIKRLRLKGIKSVRALSDELNRLNVPTALNGKLAPKFGAYATKANADNRVKLLKPIYNETIINYSAGRIAAGLLFKRNQEGGEKAQSLRNGQCY